ncbi:uncharacterized protein CLUP02_06044 [Colletotrichum lupini]|uniref:Uncharacterized protein n=1 Tax=Colletotrichum lupini TaxID=145971 RepID=A0A9Q8SPI5_9PEZI|nr:uncharacterized protein CLUP02_06044 [Colletotrichum lupini]UQC80561.1 hypothetical protein CLUP02_06044 [Colletotrichum lupini]
MLPRPRLHHVWFFESKETFSLPPLCIDPPTNGQLRIPTHMVSAMVNICLSLSTAATINHRSSAIEDGACDLVSTQSLAYHNSSLPSPPLKVFRKGKVPCRRRLTPARPRGIRTANNDPNTPARYPCLPSVPGRLQKVTLSLKGRAREAKDPNLSWPFSFCLFIRFQLPLPKPDEHPTRDFSFNPRPAQSMAGPAYMWNIDVGKTTANKMRASHKQWIINIFANRAAPAISTRPAWTRPRGRISVISSFQTDPVAVPDRQPRPIFSIFQPWFGLLLLLIIVFGGPGRTLNSVTGGKASWGPEASLLLGAHPVVSNSHTYFRTVPPACIFLSRQIVF